ncbi:MAG: DUF4349 domain-containing protein, partial [Actinomycetales bacterium]
MTQQTPPAAPPAAPHAPRPPLPGARSTKTRPARRGIAVATLALAATLAACGSSSDSGGDQDWTPNAPETTHEESAAQDSAATGTGADDATGPDVDAAQVTADGVDRVVITTGSASVLVEDPEAASTDVVELAGTYEGRVDSRHQSSDDDDAWAELVLRIPPGEVDAFVADLAEIGEVTDVAIDAEDVTGTVRDLDAEISALETSVARLEALMAESGSVADLLAAETELTTRQSELDQLRAQRTSLGEEAAMSTLSVELRTEGTADPGEQSGWSRMWEDAGEAFTGAIRGIVVAVAALAPLLVALAVVAAVVVAFVRRSRRARRAEQKAHEDQRRAVMAGAGGRPG